MKKKLFETEQEMQKAKESLIQTTTENSRSVEVTLWRGMWCLKETDWYVAWAMTSRRE